MDIKDIDVNVEGKEINLKRLDKLFDKNITKLQIIDYYTKTAKLILPHIFNKPFSMIHFPDGIYGKSFYQKRKPTNAPIWLKSIKLKSSKNSSNSSNLKDSNNSKDSIEWCLVNDLPSIIYMVNRGVIEMHTFFSRLPSLTTPDIAVIDLDPSEQNTFSQVLTVAKAFRTLLHKLNLFALPKTSGGSGIHIYIPIKPTTFKAVQHFLNTLCNLVQNALPNLCTTNRTISKRGNKIYLDAIQNSYAKTIPAPYSLRCRPNFPFSAPLSWQELDQNISPNSFTLSTISARLSSFPDPFKNFYSHAQPLPTL